MDGKLKKHTQEEGERGAGRAPSARRNAKEAGDEEEGGEIHLASVEEEKKSTR